MTVTTLTSHTTPEQVTTYTIELPEDLSCITGKIVTLDNRPFLVEHVQDNAPLKAGTQVGIQGSFIEIPQTSQLPTDPTAIAQFIWRHQDKLNQISHPLLRGTIEMGRTATRAEQRELRGDYQLALVSEADELMANFFWKHWAKEAKDGRRFELIHPTEQSGEGTAQNVLLEITDIIFFTVSLLQIAGMREDQWVEIWGDPGVWGNIPLGNPTQPQDAKRICQTCMELITSSGEESSSEDLANNLVALCEAAGINQQRSVSLYAQKLVKNYERQIRGRLQVGDTLSEIENATVR